VITRCFSYGLLVLLLAGCAASVKRPEAPQRAVQITREAAQRLVLTMAVDQASVGKDWEAFKGEWRGAFAEQARLAALPFEFREGPPRATGEPGTLAAVMIHDYRYLTPGARYGFGIMTGNAYIKSTIRFLNLANGDIMGEQQYNTTSTAWEGIFSAMTPKQVEAIAAEVVREVKAGGSRAGAAVLPIPGAQAATPAPAPASPPAAVRTATDAPKTAKGLAGGQDGFQAERLPASRACNPQPQAVLTAKGPGFETYTISCANGDALAVRCELGNCRVLQ
jgi:hypothetical protein